MDENAVLTARCSLVMVYGPSLEPYPLISAFQGWF